MSSLGEFLSAMVDLRKQKAAEMEFNARAQQAGMESLMGGIEGFGKGLMGGFGGGQTRQDVLTNQLYNRANPPRAMAVNQALQAGADTTPLEGQIPYGQQPLTQGGPFTGGVEGLKVQGVLDKSEIAAAKATQAGELGAAKISNYASMAEARDATAAYKESQLALAKEREQRLQDKADADRAMDLLTKAPQKYKDDLSAVRHYYADMKVNMAAAAGAKDQYSYDKAVEAITGTYTTGEKQGFKVSYPQIPIPAFQREAGQTLELDIARKQGQYNALYPWQSGAGIKSDIATKQAQLKELGNYNYQSPGLQPWDLPEEPSLDQYIPPQAVQPGPAQTQQQGPAPSAAAPAQEQAMSVADAQKINPNYKSGMLIRDKSTGQTFRVQ